MTGCRHDDTVYAFMANGTLEAGARRGAEARAQECASCAAELRGWRTVQASVRADATDWAAALPSSATLIEAVNRDAAPDRSSRRRLLRWILPLLLALGGVQRLGEPEPAAPPARDVFSTSKVATATVVVRVTAGHRSPLRPAALSPQPQAATTSADDAERTGADRAPAPVVVVVAPYTTAVADSLPPVEVPPERAGEPSFGALRRPLEPPPSPHLVQGTVSGPDGAGRAEVAVIAMRRGPAGTETLRAYTDVAGRYAVELPDGAWRMYVDTPAYQLRWWPDARSPLAARDIVVPLDAPLEVDFTLEASPAATISGTVRSATGGPKAGAVVIAYMRGAGLGAAEITPGQVASTALTDTAGNYVLRVTPGDYRLSASPTVWSELTRWWEDAQAPLDAMIVRVSAYSAPAADFTLPESDGDR